MRMVSFEPSLRGELQKYSNEKVAVAVVNCQVKEAAGQYQSSNTTSETIYEIMVDKQMQSNTITTEAV